MLTIKLYIPGWDWLTHDILVAHRKLGLHVMKSIALDDNLRPKRKTYSITLGLLIVNLTLSWNVRLRRS